jgi:NTP pyrophosphatase (non-canonical NTP hydrolase)
MFDRINRHTTQMIRVAIRGRTDGDGYYLAMALSWSFALANQLWIDLEEKLWESFPGVCRHCDNGRCTCSTNETERRGTIPRRTVDKPVSLQGFQQMLGFIYPDNTQDQILLRLAEDMGLLSQSLNHFEDTHSEQFFIETERNLVNVVAKICLVANCFQIDLGDEFEKNFGYGCPKCNKGQCGCKHSTARLV